MAVVNVDVGGVVDGVMTGLDKLFTSDDERERARLAMQVELQKPHMMQAIANIHEAQHPNWFVAGWRPALGWLCVSVLAYIWILRDFLVILIDATGQDVTLPVKDSGDLMTLVLALLGLGGLRTYEKLTGKAKSP